MTPVTTALVPVTTTVQLPAVLETIALPAPRKLFGLIDRTPKSPFRQQLHTADAAVKSMQASLRHIQAGLGDDSWILRNAFPNIETAFAHYYRQRVTAIATLDGLTATLSEPMLMGAAVAYDAKGRAAYAATLAALTSAEACYAVVHKTLETRQQAVTETKRAQDESRTQFPTAVEARFATIAALSREDRAALDADIAAISGLGFGFAGSYYVNKLDPSLVLEHLVSSGTIRYGRSYTSEGKKLIHCERTLYTLDDLQALIRDVSGKHTER